MSAGRIGLQDHSFIQKIIRKLIMEIQNNTSFVKIFLSFSSPIFSLTFLDMVCHILNGLGYLNDMSYASSKIITLLVSINTRTVSKDFNRFK